MEFPRLNDTQFPHLNNLNTYQYQNNFDYSRWQAECRIKLVNVGWHGDYRHTVDWASDSARDSWFDGLSGEVVELTADSRRVGTTVPIPLPYDQAAKYNYVMLVDPYPGVDYSSGKARRLFYFITNLTYRSPNTTELELQLDYWTTYINSVQINHLMLARGHWPMDRVSASSYLADPLGNSQYLTTPDVNYGSGVEQVRSTQVKNLSAGARVAVFASSIPYAEFNSAVVVGSAQAGSMPTFIDTSDRYGYQLQVNNFQLNTGYDYSQASIPARPSATSDGNIPGTYLYAVYAKDLYSGNGWAVLQRDYPLFIKSCSALMLLPANMLQLTNLATKSGIPFYSVDYNNYTALEPFTLTKQAFDYPSAYADIAKLYSYPYAYLEFSDDDNSSFQVRIESISGDTIQAVQMLSLAFPFLDWSCALTNIGGRGSLDISWTSLDGTGSNSWVYDSDFMRTVTRLGIPTYMLQLSGEKELQGSNYAAAKKAENNALLSYHNNVRTLNTGHANALASNDTMVTNTTNSGNTATANTAIAVAGASANVAAGNQANTDITELSRNLNNAYLTYDNYLQDALLAADVQYTAATTSNANQGNIAGAAVGGAISGGVMMAGGLGGATGLAAAAAGAELGLVAGPVGVLAGAAIGAAIGIPGAMITASTNSTNNNLLMTSKQTQADAAKQNNTNKTGSGNANSSAKTRVTNNLATDNVNTQNSVTTQTTANNVALANTTAANSRTTNNSNSQYARNVAVLNAQDGMRNVVDTYDYDLMAAKQARPSVYGQASGNPTMDAYARRVFNMRVKTQNDAAIAQTGDMFLRYGYAYNGVVPTTDWTGGKAFAYWQAADVWVSTGNEASDYIKLAIDSILREGTTVWADPSKVGKVSIYER